MDLLSQPELSTDYSHLFNREPSNIEKVITAYYLTEIEADSGNYSYTEEPDFGIRTESTIAPSCAEPASTYSSSKKSYHGEDATQFFKEVRHHASRRAQFHDYKRKGAYLITISKAPSTPLFSKIIGDLTSAADTSVPFHISQRYLRPEHNQLSPRLQLTSTGEIISAQLTRMIEEYPMFDFPIYAVMPDHIHILWVVKEELPQDLGHYVGRFKALCTKVMHEANGLPTVNEQHRQHSQCEDAVFAEKFNDKIVFSNDIYWRFASYILDNPRRRLMAMTKPEYFTRTIRLSINGQEFDAYGNFQLLRHPLISPVIISRRDTEARRQQLHREWEEISRAGGVLISPFISPAEREVMKAGIAGNACIIRLIPDGLMPKYKPSGFEFELCAQGRLLHIGVPKECASNVKLKREVALYFNDIAKTLAAMPATTRMLLKGGRR